MIDVPRVHHIVCFTLPCLSESDELEKPNHFGGRRVHLADPQLSRLPECWATFFVHLLECPE
jgi:hypothetical protein